MRSLQRLGESVTGPDRRLFIPETIFDRAGDGWLYPVHRGEEPERWEALVATDAAVITQVDDGAERGIFPTCSSTAPWLMRRMLDLLQVEPGQKVLEIGTGTGYNAALLAAAGAEVVSVEIDAGLAEHARAALAATGLAEQVTVITGDGEAGWPAGGPYERVIATAAGHTIPYDWIQQATEGARIVTPYTGPGHSHALLVLTVREGRAEGGTVGTAPFMPLRGQRLSQPELQALTDAPGLKVVIDQVGQRITVLEDPAE